jgi:hypothetical protein
MHPRIRTGVLIVAMVIVACGDDDTPAPPDSPGDAGDAAPTAGSLAPPPNERDAASTKDEDAGMTPDAGAVGLADAAMPPEGPDCSDGEMPCDGECITEIAPTLTDIHARIVERGCALSASCHTGVRPKEGLDLTTPEGMLEFVGKRSAQQPSLSVIEPGEPDRSYLIHKLRGEDIAASSSTGAAATRMPPPPTDPLCEAKIRILEAWIAAGARDD